jgi:hypothetical protein
MKNASELVDNPRNHEGSKDFLEARFLAPCPINNSAESERILTILSELERSQKKYNPDPRQNVMMHDESAF